MHNLLDQYTYHAQFVHQIASIVGNPILSRDSSTCLHNRANVIVVVFFGVSPLVPTVPVNDHVHHLSFAVVHYRGLI